ncbi:MAG TPA: CRTAC1 family protein [Candidatus Latescibacteria bacterium]|nr:CRTAC1 family protein [Candidatus Latescibacterota bacterium]
MGFSVRSIDLSLAVDSKSHSNLRIALLRLILIPNRRTTLLFFLVLLFSCRQEPVPEAVDTSSYATTDHAETSFAGLGGPPRITYTDVTDSSGIDFVHATGAFGEKWMPESLASGVVLFDYDDDGRLDVLFVNGTFWDGHPGEGSAPTLALYRNLGGFCFEETTREAGLDVAVYGMGGTAGDYDGDGDKDLFVTTVEDNLLFRNDEGVFVDVTETAGVDGGRWQTDKGRREPEWSTSAAWLDYDRDGWLDLFVGNYVQWSPETDLFTSIDGENKSYATPQEYKGLSSRLYRNLGNERFEDVSVRAGVYNEEGKTMGIAITDYDRDGDPDIFVTNDTQPNFLYRNGGDGTFEDVALLAGVAYDGAGRARAGMGVDVASVDTSGSLGIAIGNFSRESLSLYVQSWKDLFIDFAGKKRIATPTLLPLTFGVVFADVDLDGHQDIICVNGHLEPEINRIQKEITYRQVPQLFWNNGATQFEEVTSEAGSAFARPIVGRGLAYGDIDNDGDLDLVMVENSGKPIVARNDTKTLNGIRVELVGQAPNTGGIGATVRVHFDDRSVVRTVRTGSSYLSQNETTLTFGLGSITQADSVEVTWGSGEQMCFTMLESGFIYRISETGTINEKTFATSK